MSSARGRSCCHLARLTAALLLVLTVEAFVLPSVRAHGPLAASSDGNQVQILRDAGGIHTVGSGGAPRAETPPDAEVVDPALSRSLSPADRLARYPSLLQYGAHGRLVMVSGLPLAEAREALFPVSRTRPLPDGYVPGDLARDFRHPLRALIVDDLRAMLQAAARDGAYPEVVSGYRSAEYQAVVFERAVQRQLGQNAALTREEAEDRAAHFVAFPGRSQHQLGTTADFSSYEIGYAIRATFAETVAGRWLAEHGWEYGFVMPYTTAAVPRSGYVHEPWHYRWVGRPLAAFLWEERYLESSYPTADDWLLALESLLQDRTP